MKIKVLLFLSIATLLNVSCGGQKANGLVVTVIPSQPYVIPFGSTTVNGTAVSAPYFILNNINLAWAGTGTATDTLEIVTIIISSPANFSGGGTNTTTINCGIAGDSLTASFPNNVVNNNVIVNSGIPAESSQIPCGGLTLPNPIPQTLSATAQVQVVGIIINAAGNATGRITSTQNITVQ